MVGVDAGNLVGKGVASWGVGIKEGVLLGVILGSVEGRILGVREGGSVSARSAVGEFEG